MKIQKQVPLTEGPILKSLTGLAVPIMISSFLGTLYNITDMAWIGLLGSKAVAAVGVGGMYVWLSQGLASLARMGGQVHVAQCLGRGDKEQAHRYAKTAVQLSILLGLAFAAVSLLFTDSLVGFFKLEGVKTILDAKIYMRITCGLILFSFLNLTLTGLYTAQGDSKTPFVANFIGESNILSGTMLEDYKVQFDDIVFDCVDYGFKKNEKVDVVIRPEDIDIVPVEDGKMTGEVLSVLFKGVHYEIMVETVPGTSVTVNMRVIRNHDVTSEDGTEKISANNFYVDIDDVENMDDKEIIALANAQAWEVESDEYVSIAKVEYELAEEEGQYPVTFTTANGTSIECTIFVVDQPFVKNEKANEAVMAFNFIKTATEIQESQALDTDLKTWANAQGWKLSNEDESVDISVDYDFDSDEITEGVYPITFSTTGREFKIHTTDYTEEGQEVGLTFFPEDIHVMSKGTY